jgi:outer membrane receptor protein involved in Fe transport
VRGSSILLSEEGTRSMPLDRRLALLALVVGLPVAVPMPIAAQATGTSAAATGEIRLQVKDSSGHPLVARGTLYGPSAGHSVSVESASDGSLLATGLSFGRYSLELADAGFATQRVQFVLSARTPAAHRDVVMAIGGLNTTVNVISSTPIGAMDVPLSDVPVPVQTMSAQTIVDTNAIDLTDAMKRRLNGVYVNENQNNPFQPDVNYRGYTASPLVGSPAGLSVYLDGVRQNQPFGDVVQWDLIPKVAISTTELIPGSNPLYGLNTLGGALAVQTKNGLSNSGFHISGYGGSFGRRAVDAEYGGSAGAWNWFAAGTLFHEDGWRTQSPSSVKQSFVKLGYTAGSTVVALSSGYAINNLVGNGTQDFRAINRTVGLNHGYNSVYSIPDSTYQHQPFLTLNVTQGLGHGLTLNANAYVRSTRTNTTNGDINDDSFDQSLYTLSNGEKTALTRAGIAFPTTAITPANTPYPYLRCVGQALLLDEPGEKCTGVVTDTVNRQHASGVSGVLGWRTARNQFSIGAALDHGGLTFQQSGQYGYLNTDGISVTRVPAFLNGSTQVDGDPQDNRVNLHGTTHTPSFFFTDTLSIHKWVLTAGGRYNHTNINNQDRLPPVAYRGTLTAVNIYQRFNPTAGIVYKPNALLHAYFNYGESSRAPTSTELGCSDPNFPCSLPNALVSDPPLKQVVSRTYEFGVRGNPDGRYRWSAGYFHTNNYDDLLFVAAQTTSYGYFQNFGKTRRQGVEASAMAHLRNLDAGAQYTFLEATYQSPQTLGAPANSSNSVALAGFRGVSEGGTINIVAGNHIPQIPQQMFKLYADYHPLKKLAVNADFQALGSSYVRGNENNQHQPDGRYYLGSGKSPSYGVVNLGSRYSISPHYEIFAQINNLLNRRYYTAGQLSTTPYDDNGNFTPRAFAAYANGDYPGRNSTFLAPGAPITVFGGVKVSFGTR